MKLDSFLWWIRHIYNFYEDILGESDDIYTEYQMLHTGVNTVLLIATILFCSLINGIAFYLWCRAQTPLRAAILAIAGGITCQCFCILLFDSEIWNQSIAIAAGFYIALISADIFKKKCLPWLSLPAVLEWREPELVPSMMPIIKWIGRILDK